MMSRAGDGGNLGGVLPMLITPFQANGEIAYDDLRRVLDFVLGAAPDGVSVLGLAGEVGALSTDERISITDVVLRNAGALPVVVGCSAPDTVTALRLVRHAADGGAAAVMIAPPSASDWGRDRVVDHYLQLARASAPVPVMVQDAPAFIGTALDEDLVEHLAALEPGIRYAKPEVLPAAEPVARLMAAGLRVFGGHGGLYAIDVLEAGAAGLIPGPEVTAGLTEVVAAWTDGRAEDARALHQRLLPLLSFEFQGLAHYVRCSKALLGWFGALHETGSRAYPEPLGSVSRRQLLERAARVGLSPGKAVQRAR